MIEPIITALLIAQPDDPKFFMLCWLKKLYSLDYIFINKEKEELENLRLQVRNLKQKKEDSKININKIEANKSIHEIKIDDNDKEEKKSENSEKSEKKEESKSSKKSFSNKSNSDSSSSSSHNINNTNNEINDNKEMHNIETNIKNEVINNINNDLIEKNSNISLNEKKGLNNNIDNKEEQK